MTTNIHTPADILCKCLENYLRADGGLLSQLEDENQFKVNARITEPSNQIICYDFPEASVVIHPGMRKSEEGGAPMERPAVRIQVTHSDPIVGNRIMSAIVGYIDQPPVDGYPVVELPDEAGEPVSYTIKNISRYTGVGEVPDTEQSRSIYTTEARLTL
jgi:hypothetical protein